jgi:Do/DeqQ family serine protease
MLNTTSNRTSGLEHTPAWTPRSEHFSWVSAGVGFLAASALAGSSFWFGQHWQPSSTVPAAPPLSSAPLPIQAMGYNTVADIAAQASKYVVNIDTKKSVSVPDAPFHFNLPFKDFEFFFGPGFEPFDEKPMMPRKYESRGTGSGVIYRSDGYILTNNHVVQADEITVTLADKRTFKGTVVGRDSFTDLALVKIDAQNLPAAKLGSSKTLRPGDWAIAIGSPLGLDHTVTFGIVSALGRSLSDLGANVQLIQTDAAINPGNSGGPLLNIQGEVIGLNTAIRSDAQNVGFAIPVDTAKEVASKLLSNGKITHAYLGIYMQDLNDDLRKSLGINTKTNGVLVARIASNSPADKAGLQEQDVIEKINGNPVTSSKQVQEIVRQHKPGDRLNFLVLRNGTFASVDATIGDYPAGDKE